MKREGTGKEEGFQGAAVEAWQYFEDGHSAETSYTVLKRLVEKQRMKPRRWQENPSQFPKRNSNVGTEKSFTNIVH